MSKAEQVLKLEPSSELRFRGIFFDLFVVIPESGLSVLCVRRVKFKLHVR